MNKIYTLLFLIMVYGGFAQNREVIQDNLGQVTFFSYTSVENIEAVNNTVETLIDLSKETIAVRMLMRTFEFKKALMEEHFNESYVESDLYPYLKFGGKIPGIKNISPGNSQTIVVKGNMEFHGVNKEVEVKTTIENKDGEYNLSGGFAINIDDYEIKVPGLLAPNIAKTIEITFKFEYEAIEQ